MFKRKKQKPVFISSGGYGREIIERAFIDLVGHISSKFHADAYIAKKYGDYRKVTIGTEGITVSFYKEQHDKQPTASVCFDWFMYPKQYGYSDLEGYILSQVMRNIMMYSERH